MPKPACVACGRFFRPLYNGVVVAEMMPKGIGAEPGKDHLDQWQDYKCWRADEWQCEGCGARIVVGYGFHPLAEHYQPHFDSARALATIVVNDC
jgi:hypothetical protein